MNTNTHPPAPQPYTPSQWRTRWYRFLRLCSRLYRKRPRFDVNQALKEQRWQILQYASEQYAGRCPHHPDAPPMYEREPGDFRCFLCYDEAYLRQALWMPEPAESHTDPHAVQVPVSPFLAYRLRMHPQASPETQSHRAVYWPETERENS